MATKAEILKLVTDVLETAGIEEATINEVAEILRPKAGGKSVDLSEVTRVDADGNITELECSICGVWLPATEEYFYEDKSGKGPNGLKRVSKQGESAKKAFLKSQRASEKGIMADFTSGDLDPEEAKTMLADLATKTADYSAVGIIVEAEDEEDVA